MHKRNLETLERRVITDPVFRSQFMVDPEVAISEAGLDLRPDDLQALKAWHANLQVGKKIEDLERALAAFVASRISDACK